MGLRDCMFHSEYRSVEHDLYREFYGPCLRNSHKYDRAVGYFRSSIATHASVDLAEFAVRGGRLRLICSPELTEEDISAMDKGYRERETVIASRLLQVLKEIAAQQRFTSNVELLSGLISYGSLEIRIATMESGRGLFHDKIGIFEDVDGNRISFKGSVNDSLSAWRLPETGGNGESFDVFRSWKPYDEDRVVSHAGYFERLWNGDFKQVDVTPLPDVVKTVLNETAVQPKEFIRQHTSVSDKSPKVTINPRKHQKEVLENWVAEGCRGIVKHATGSGKTFTALMAIKRALDNTEPVIVVVPSELLFRQWEHEIRSVIGDDLTILKVSSEHPKWKRPGWVRASTEPDEDARTLVLASLRSAASDNFINEVVPSDKLLIVVDEVHRAGSSYSSQVFRVAAGKRLGLSATPERYRDSEGTSRIMSYFERILDPVYSLSDAINDKHLVPYEYHPHTVTLTDEESDQYSDFTKRLLRLWDRTKNGPREGSEAQFQLLLIQRSRVVKKASSKTELAWKILSKARQGEKWLVYCEDGDHLEKVRARLQGIELPIHEYRVEMTADPVNSLAWFVEEGGIMLSIRCLDEGVDIPSISHALVLASSQNPRQFIQRRGRVLRKDPRDRTKLKAFVHDALVVPESIGGGTSPFNYAVSELSRAWQFAEGAINGSCKTTIRNELIKLGLDTNDFEKETLEYEDE